MWNHSSENQKHQFDRDCSLTLLPGRDLCSCEKNPTPLQVSKCCCWQTLLKQIVSYTFKWPQSCSEPLGMPVVFTMLHSKTSTRSSQLAEFKLNLWAVLLFSGKAFQRASCAFWILQETTVIQRFSRRLPCIQESLLGWLFTSSCMRIRYLVTTVRRLKLEGRKSFNSIWCADWKNESPFAWPVHHSRLARWQRPPHASSSQELQHNALLSIAESL